MSKDKKERKIGYSIAGNALTVTISHQSIVICKEAFSDEDWNSLAFQGILVKIQRASAGSESATEADQRRLRKARELAEGQLNSVAQRVDVQAIEKAATLKAAAAMAANSVPVDVILTAFPVLGRAEVEQMVKAFSKPGKSSK